MSCKKAFFQIVLMQVDGHTPDSQEVCGQASRQAGKMPGRLAERSKCTLTGPGSQRLLLLRRKDGRNNSRNKIP